MPPEPNDKMDELLKAYAERRRKEAGAPFEMHPATRQMLHAEVARRNAHEDSSPRAKIGKWHFLNPARIFLYSTGLAAAVICAALVIREQRPFSTGPKPAQELAYAKPADTASPQSALAIATSTPADLLALTAKTLESGKQQDLLMAGRPGQVNQSDGQKIDSKDVVRIESGANPRTTDYIKNKLNHIIIPKIEFRDATVREALAFLQQKSREFDKTEADPARKGVNIVLRTDRLSNLSEAQAAAKPSIQGDLGSTVRQEAKITLSLTNIPLAEALRYVTNLSGLMIKVDPYAVTIVPLSYAEILLTKEWIAPAGFLAGDAIASGSDALSSQNIQKAIDASTASEGKNLPLRASAKALLIENGIPFPPGAYAKYDRERNTVIVRNTVDNLDLVQQYLGSLNTTAGVHLKTEPSEAGGTALQNQPGVLAKTGIMEKDTGSMAMQTDKVMSSAEAARPEGASSSDLAQNSPTTAPAGAPIQPAPVVRAAPVTAGRLPAAQALPRSEPAPGGPSSPVLDAAAAASPARILALFEIQLNGDQIRLIDADGSVYTGTIDLPKLQRQHLVVSKSRMFSNQAVFAGQSYADAGQQSAYKKQAQVPSGMPAGLSNSIASPDTSLKNDQAAQKQQGYPFRASGNCRSLARIINVEGTYYTDVPQEQDPAEAKQQAALDADSGAMGGASASGARIRGQAQIGNNMRIDINAISVPLKTKSN